MMRLPAILMMSLLLLLGCSIRSLAVRNLADAVSTGAGVYASDDDPELIREALPFALKLNESLLAETPGHRELLTSLCGGFTQYSYAYIEQDADRIEPENLAKAKELRQRARKLYLRARDYGLRGLDVAHGGFAKRLQEDAKLAVAECVRADVPLLYWTAVSWGAAIALSKDRPDVIADQPIVEALIDRAMELDEAFDGGAIHCFLITYEMARKGEATDAATRATMHYRRAVLLSHGHDAAPMLCYAESVCLARQDRSEFEATLHLALKIDPDAYPANRLINLVMQQRARWLLSRVNELFVE